MVTFLEFFYEKTAISPDVRVNIEGIGEFTAKADTGNDGFNVIHGTDVQNDGDVIHFTCNGKQCSALSLGSLMVNKGPDHKENRHVISISMAVNGKVYRNQPFTVSDRSGMAEQVLLSKDFLQKMNCVVDPSMG